MSHDDPALRPEIDRILAHCGLGPAEAVLSDELSAPLTVEIAARVAIMPEFGKASRPGKATDVTSATASSRVHAQTMAAAADPELAATVIQSLHSHPLVWARGGSHTLNRQFDAEGHEGCAPCGQRGRVTCRGCSGGGEVTCSGCRGAGGSPCNACGATGKANCVTCFGSRYQQVQVPNPGGHGYSTQSQTCQGCNGSGKSYSIPCAYCRSGTVTCTGCGGKGRQTCGTCKGSRQVRCEGCAGHGQLTITHHGKIVAQCTVVTRALGADRDHAAAVAGGLAQVQGLPDFAPRPVAKPTSLSATYRATVPFAAATLTGAGKSWRLRAVGREARLLGCPNFADDLLAGVRARLASARGTAAAATIDDFVRAPLGKAVVEAAAAGHKSASAGPARPAISPAFLSGLVADAGKCLRRAVGGGTLRVWLGFLALSALLGLVYWWGGYMDFIHRNFVSPSGRIRPAPVLTWLFAPFVALWIVAFIVAARRGQAAAARLGQTLTSRRAAGRPFLMLVAGLPLFVAGVALGMPGLATAWPVVGQIQTLLLLR